MIRYESGRCEAGTALYVTYHKAAERYASEHGGRVEWADEYNDYSVQGRWIVR